GNLISILYEKGKKLSYLTDGQRVPEDIERANRLRLLKTLEGFPVDTIRLKQKFEEYNYAGTYSTDSDMKDAVTPAEQQQLYSIGTEMTKTKWGEK
ncbi:MAG: hypothetical protein SVR04_06295, partial [Spirochaetota bacterium]|nr:hypothetical protein [Spirochaetota bacterium]